MNQQGYIPFEVYSQLHKSKGVGMGYVLNGSAGKTGSSDAAGILIVSPDLQEILLLKRSSDVEDRYLWSIPGGDSKKTGNGLEAAIITAVTESNEEMGGLPTGRIREQPYVYHKPGIDFTYKTFILEIDPDARESFVPKLNWENTDYKWFRRDELKSVKLHPGVEEVLDNYKFEPDGSFNCTLKVLQRLCQKNLRVLKGRGKT
jgi:8-oxo-dGTP pyrophosphatase MutT (NUDIX family)|tara:strand:+ start:485 stop:1093 length:609 start_codon:yes stop_codon:yes gene_type:complete